MILEQEIKDVQISGQFDKRSFSINPSAKAFVILSENIYTHKVRAVIREISCNAYDSHIDANNSETFDVHLPTSIESWFSVRDYGTGISHEQMLTLYTEFFTSTRNKSNKFVGALGLGRISVFSICDSFTVTSFYGGIKSIYSVYKDKDGIPQIALLSQNPTDEPNGILVSVTVEQWRISEFRMEAVNVYKYFDLVPNINIESITEEINKNKELYVLVGNDYGVTTSSGSLFAVMGNVAYSIDSSMNPCNLDGYIKFNIGELGFDPGREKLSLDENTKKNLKVKVQQVVDSISQLMLNKIEAEPTIFKRAIAYDTLNNGNLHTLIRKSTLKSKFDTHKISECSTPIKYFNKFRKTASVNTTSILDLSKSLYYLHKDKFTHRLKRHAEVTCKKLFVLTQAQIDELKIDPEFIIDIETIPKIEKSKYSSSYKSSDIKELVDGREREITTILKGEKVYIPIYFGDPSMDCSWLDNIRSTKYKLDTISKYINIPAIFLVKVAYTKKSTFVKNGWISLNDYINREVSLTKKIGCLEYDGVYSNIFENVYSRVGHLLDDNSPITLFCKKFKNYKKREKIKILEKIGMYDDSLIDSSLNKYEDQILEENPIFELVDISECSYSSAHMSKTINVLVNYLCKELKTSCSLAKDI